MNAVLHYVEDMGLTMLLLLPLWAVLRGFWLRLKGRKVNWRREILLAVFVLYLVALANETIVPEIILDDKGIQVKPWNFNGCNYIPLYTIRTYFLYGTASMVAVNLLGNVLIFAPMGLFPPLLWKFFRKPLPGIGFGALTSIFIEVVQPLIGRSRDIDDVILNTLGCALGYGLFAVIRRMRNLL